MGAEDERPEPKETVDPGPFSFETVLHDELEFIQAARRHRGDTNGVRQKTADDGPDQRALESNLTGLAFSGGGIRSATFNLGVLQGLAELGLLKRFDYLSTVSGGGYIGSWLTALIHRTFESLEARKKTSEENGEPPPQRSPDEAVLEVERRLRTAREDSLGDDPVGDDRVEQHRVEHHAITFLRRFSNYLTPKVGVFSADSWTVGTTYLRNLILNLVVLISAFGLALLAPRLLGWSLRDLRGVSAWLWLAFTGIALLLAVMEVGLHFGSFTVRNGANRRDLTQGRVQKRIVLPFLLGALLFTVWLTFGEPVTFRGPLSWLDGLGPGFQWALFGVGIYGGGWVLGALRSRIRYRWDERKPMDVEWWRLILSAALAGLLGGLGLWALDTFLTSTDGGVWRALTWGPPLLLTLFVLVGFFQTGFAGREIHDHQREWLSRLGAWMLIYGVGWLLLLLASTAATALYFWLGGWIAAAAATGWLGATLAGLLAGRGTERPEGSVGKTRAFIARAAPYVFVTGLVLLLAVGLDFGLSRIGDLGGWGRLQGMRAELAEARTDLDAEDRETREAAEGCVDELGFGAFLDAQHRLMDESGPAELWGSAGALLVLFVLFGWRVDINEFSMHRLYRNRLVRAYLGASVPPTERDDQVQPFTGFSLDDLLMTRLAPTDPKDPGSVRYGAPLHLINTNLNLVAGEELAWQERRGASFILSPLYSGFRTVEDRGSSSDGPFGYRRTAEYPKTDRHPAIPGYASEPKKLTLGSAFTISGAAVSPNMGFRSSPALAFLLTVFNVRLGWWLGNPSRPGTWKSSGPLFGPLHLLYEVFGLTSERNKYVYLSDGGHFENLGIYELVRRRCRFIVATDAGADHDMEFQDLGNAIRKCRTDLGIEIDLHPVALRSSEDTGLSNWHCAVGTIHYDDRHRGQGKGTLLYLKTSMTGDEPEDVHNYRRQSPEFPHQSTGDQFFDESQFESYRKLGHHVALSALEEDVPAGSFRLEQLAQRLRQRWYPPSPATEKSFTRLAETMDEIFERARRDTDLDFLDPQFYPEWSSLLTGEPETEPPTWLPPESKPEKRRAGFYFCNELIQLMENVYLDLDLEHDHDHPDNRGWMNLFRHWSWSGMFRVTWAIACSTYGKRFVDFCERKLGLQPFQGLECQKAESLEKALAEKGPLNFLERDMLQRFQKENGERIAEVYTFDVVVQAPGALDSKEDSEKKAKKKAEKKTEEESQKSSDTVCFRCGFAALDENRQIVVFRIQDHLRKMGLARRALRKLLEEVPEADCTPVTSARPEDQVKVPDEYKDEFSEVHRIRFVALFRSVRQEVGLKR